MKTRTRKGLHKPAIAALALAIAAFVGLDAGSAHAQPQLSTLEPVNFPPENPFSEEKRVLGKILFWDEQLSGDNTMSCGTCHIPEAAGADPNFGITDGPDGVPMTFDDVFGSFGVVPADADNNYIVDATFDTLRQVTGRSANSTINAAFADELFWDGRATSEFIDPETGEVAIAAGGALESQVVGPPLSDIEMAHAFRNWSQITTKLQSARPLALATDLTPDQAQAIADHPTYPRLFQAAFGDPAITAKRIAFAIATYERTLISDKSPWDNTQLGLPGGMTPRQVDGWVNFQQARCDTCHTPPLFTDNMYRNIGNRDPQWDGGRQDVTGLFEDRGKFKTPGLRNAGLKTRFMHAGEEFNLNRAIRVYIDPPNFDDNLDPFMFAVNLNVGQVDAMLDFIGNALTDPRVANGLPPFDRPTLRSELPANPAIIGNGYDNGSGSVPVMLASTPPNAGNDEFKVGAAGIAEGQSMTLYISSTPPAGEILTPDETMGPFSAASGAGVAPAVTAFWPVPDDATMDGETVYFQWVVDDTGARSPVAAATIFCGTGGCAPTCPADVNNDGLLTPADFSAWINAYNAGC